MERTKPSAYQNVLQVMAGLLVVGFIANLLVRPVAKNIGWQSRKITLDGIELRIFEIRQ